MSDELNDGGPAFPVTEAPYSPNNHGMSLRDWFAGQALAGLLAQSSGTAFGSDHSIGALWAYQMADAMLAARKSRP